jgi:hypothetical protein
MNLSFVAISLAKPSPHVVWTPGRHLSPAQLRLSAGTLVAGGQYVLAFSAGLANDPSAAAEATYPISVRVQASICAIVWNHDVSFRNFAAIPMAALSLIHKTSINTPLSLLSPSLF